MPRVRFRLFAGTKSSPVLEARADPTRVQFGESGLAAGKHCARWPRSGKVGFWHQELNSCRVCPICESPAGMTCVS